MVFEKLYNREQGIWGTFDATVAKPNPTVRSDFYRDGNTSSLNTGYAPAKLVHRNIICIKYRGDLCKSLLLAMKVAIYQQRPR